MSWFRQVIYGHDPKEPKPRRRRRWIKILAIVLLFGLAWYFGIIASVYSTLTVVAIAIWEMLGNVVDACWDFVQYVLRVARH